MIKEYIINNEPLNTVLDKIATFIKHVTKFDELHGGYNYEVSISKNRDLWSAKLKIDNETKHDTKISKTITEAPSVL